jgi:hypothetical protein
MYVYMYVCMYVCTYTCMYVCGMEVTDSVTVSQKAKPNTQLQPLPVLILFVLTLIGTIRNNSSFFNKMPMIHAERY